MSAPPFSLSDLRARCSQSFDGEAHLTNEELLALVDAVESTMRHARRLEHRRAQRQEPTWLPPAVKSALSKFEPPPWRKS